MGEVYQGAHSGEGVDVAVKVITAARARQERFRRAFREEVRAVAGLEHPGIVMVLEVGEVDTLAEEASGGRLVAGSPYLAMELARGGALSSRPFPTSWETLRSDLLSLLDVLAHAHARGVIHRDLKLGNVLVYPEANGQARLKLADFGLAHATDRAERAIRGTSGTPLYMAPEQFRGAWRDFGPWTDLYALGCIGYLLAAGFPPFNDRAFSKLMAMHTTVPRPALTPRFPVPEGLNDWLHQLMAIDPLERFQCAADAVTALVRLGPAVASPSTPQPSGDTPAVAPPAPTMTLSPSFLQWCERTTVDEIMANTPAARDEVAAERQVPRVLPPVPQSWRIGAPPVTDMRLLGAGLGLYGLRPIPLVGRVAQRDAIWTALRSARATGDTHVTVLKGTAGTGKSRLAQWMVERSAELGAALSLRAEHSPSGGVADGLPHMLRRAIGCLGMSRLQLRERVSKWLAARGSDDPYEVDALVEVMWPSADGARHHDEVQVRFERPSERYAVIHRLLARLSRMGTSEEGLPIHRAAMLWLDDAQWGSDAIGLAEYLLRNGRDGPCPIIVLLTVREETLPDLPDVAARLDALSVGDRGTLIPVPPLDPALRTELVQNLLGLDGELAAMVEDRTDGNPLFAVQLVGDWVQRGVLTVGEGGFQLKPGERAELPDNIHQLWDSRIERVIESFPSGTHAALELASLLGARVDESEWLGACNVARVQVPPHLVPNLTERRLAQVDDAGWSFAHGMMRESLERSARESGRWRDLHDACATMLQIRYGGSHQPGVAERLGKHLYEAGRLNEALEPLREAARERAAISDYAAALPLLDLQEQTMAALDTPRSDIRWGEALVLRADLLTSLGRLDEAGQAASTAVENGRERGWNDVLAKALRQAGNVRAKQGDLEASVGHYREAVEAAHDDDVERARALLALGDISRLRGDHARARRTCLRALEVFTALGHERGQAEVLLGLAGANRLRGDLERTEELVRRALPLLEASDHRFGIGSAWNTLGEVLRLRRDLSGAEAAYRKSEAMLHRLGSAEQMVPRLNLALVLMAQSRYAEAHTRMAQVLDTVRRDGRQGLEAVLTALILPCCAHAGDWLAFAANINIAEERLSAAGLVDSDIAWATELAGELALERGALGQAERAYRLALSQREGLGEVPAITRLERALADLDAVTRV